MADTSIYTQETISEEDSDAQVLWNDVCDELEGNLPDPTIAMFRSCVGLSLDDETLVIGANNNFIHRNIDKNEALIISTIESIAFQPLKLQVKSLSRKNADIKVDLPFQTTITSNELETLQSKNLASFSSPEATVVTYSQTPYKRATNPLIEKITPEDSTLTFNTFIEGEENLYALQAAKAVANGSTGYNPLFIYGKSGLGKTHLLKAIQNYLADNEPEKVCVYRNARDFIKDYSSAMINTDRSVKEAFEQNYHDIDVLIIDDVQSFKGAVKSIDFFFDTFNYLKSTGKQIVLAADRTPIELGFDERVSSRLDSAVTLAIQAPSYELKLNLIKAFYERMKNEAYTDGIEGYSGTISEENLEFMAKKAGTNIRTIKAFCQSCLFEATKRENKGEIFTREDITKAAVSKWGLTQRTFNIDQIQTFIEQRYNITHTDLVSNKRNKELMEPRHVAVWLTRELTDSTLAQIGDRFGGRTHATVKHSIKWVEDRRKEDRMLYERIQSMKEDLLSNA